MGSDFQRTLMWVILVASCFMLWDNWNVYNGKPSFFGEPATTQTEQTADDFAYIAFFQHERRFAEQ